jgi:hypothetical protein
MLYMLLPLLIYSQGKVQQMTAQLIADAYAHAYTVFSNPQHGYHTSSSSSDNSSGSSSSADSSSVPFLVHTPAQVRIILDCDGSSDD